MKKRSGLALLESILAASLLAGVMILLFNLYPTAAMAVRQSQDQLTADSIAQSILDELRVASFNSLVVGSTVNRTPIVRGDVTFRPTVQVFATGGDTAILVGARVTVSYDSVRGKPRQVVHELYLLNMER